MSDVAIGSALILTGAILRHRGRRAVTHASSEAVTSPS